MQNLNLKNKNIFFALYLGTQTSVLLFVVINYLFQDVSAIPLYLYFLPLVAFFLVELISSNIFQKKNSIRSFARFLLIGTSNTIVDFFIFNLLLSFSSIEGFVLAKVISFCVALVHSLYWNSKWSFDYNKEITFKLSGTFLAVTLVGLSINLSISYGLLYLLTPIVTLPPTILANLVVLIATVFSLTWNYIGYRKFVFK